MFHLRSCISMSRGEHAISGVSGATGSRRFSPGQVRAGETLLGRKSLIVCQMGGIPSWSSDIAMAPSCADQYANARMHPLNVEFFADFFFTGCSKRTKQEIYFLEYVCSLPSWYVYLLRAVPSRIQNIKHNLVCTSHKFFCDIL